MLPIQEFIYRRDDGDKIKVEVRISEKYGNVVYYVYVTHCAKFKRKYLPVYDKSEYEYRRLSWQDRAEYRKKKALEFVTRDELLECVEKAHQALKPVLDKNLEF